VSRPRRYTDAEIIAATQRCVLAHGPSVSTTVIADEVGMSQAALFKRFGTKERLIVTALCQMPDKMPLIGKLLEGPTEAPVRDQMVALGTELITLFRHLVPCFAMLAASGLNPTRLSQPDSPPIIARKAWTTWFQIAQDQGRARPFDAAAVAVAFLGMLHARPFRELVIGDTGLKCSDVVYVEQIVDLFWSGMAPERAP